jgi:hypothetical protein
MPLFHYKKAASQYYSGLLLLAARNVGLAASRALFAAIGSLSHSAKRQHAQQAQHLNDFTHGCHLLQKSHGESRLSRVKARHDEAKYVYRYEKRWWNWASQVLGLRVQKLSQCCNVRGLA